jgi:hypothetical protein
MSVGRFITGSGFLLVLAGVASAGTLLNYPSGFAGGDFSTTGFSSPTAPLATVGNGWKPVLNGTQLVLAGGAQDGGPSYQSGAVYSSSVVTLGANDAFSTSFQFQFTNPGGGYLSSSPADGITFALFLPICTDPSTCPPIDGFNSSGLGYYQNAPQRTFGVEFDTVDDQGTGSSNHVALLTGYYASPTNQVNVYGVSNCGFPGSAYKNAGCMANGDVWTANISYDGSDVTVTLYDPKEGFTDTVLNAVRFNISSTLCAGWPSFQGTCPGTNIYAGITASTGGNYQTESILNWTLSDGSMTTATPEPSSGVLLEAGLLMLALRYCTVTPRRIARWKLWRPVSRRVMDSRV